MSGTMRERVARAIAAADGEDYMEDCERYDARAHAAIAAMREPTEAMQDAGAYPRENRKPVADIWQAMIDSELGERD